MLIGLPLAKQEIPHDGKGKRIFSKIGSGELRDINDLVGHMEMNYEEQLTTQYEGIKGGSMSCLGGGWLDLENNNLYKSIIQPYENPINPDEPIFYYHSDHLGSASFLTDRDGYETQQLVYLPFGEDWVDLKYNTQQYDTPYKFNGKEKDQETGYNNYGARYYYDWASIWLSVDPMSDKYPSLTSYNYCANNPVMLVDPDGRDNVIYLVNLQGKNQKVNPERLIAETNKRFKSLGLNTRMELAPDGKDFNPAYMDNTDSYAVLGSADDVKGFIKSKDQEAYDNHFNDWSGGTNNPERSTNTMGKKTNVIGLDANNLSGAAKIFGTSSEKMGAFLVLHGAGHNANLNHSDVDGRRDDQNPYNASIMNSGNRNANINNLLRRETNSKYIEAINQYFGGRKSQATYNYNKKRANGKVIHY